MAKVGPILALVGAMLSAPSTSLAVSPLILSGTLAGTVRDLLGTPQMGAVVFLYDHREKLCERGLTDAFGNFSFKGLNPDLYSVRVTLASFLPALRSHIQIVPGARKNLEVSLSTLFSSIQLVTPQPGQAALMNDDWKWVLRTSAARRPVLRILPGPTTQQQQSSTSIFSDTHGLVRLSGGDATSGSEADMGTQFGVETSVFGANQLELVGNVGYASATGMPAAGFRTTLRRKMGDSTPSVSVTMRQLSVPSHFNSALAGVPGLDSGAPFLRSVSIGMSNKTQLSDELTVEYGMQLDSYSYLSHNHSTSSYAKLTYVFPFAVVDFAYAAGNAQPELGNSSAAAADSDLERDFAALAMIPRVTLLNNSAKMQTGEDYQLGISRAFGSREVHLTGYREAVKNAALTVSMNSAAIGGPLAADILPDLFSDTSVLNAGDYHTLGYTAALTQNLGENYHLTVSYGLVGVLVPGLDAGPIADEGQLRDLIRATHRGALTTQASGTVRRTGTKFSGSYQFTDYRTATSGQLYATDPSHPQSGLNLCIRQPIPHGFNMPGRMEATLDLKNMLAQGYMPLTLTGGQQLLLMRTPRTLRGGLSFTF